MRASTKVLNKIALEIPQPHIVSQIRSVRPIVSGAHERSVEFDHQFEQIDKQSTKIRLPSNIGTEEERGQPAKGE